jgi:NADH-quinone oxidoreductase subunit M
MDSNLLAAAGLTAFPYLTVLTFLPALSGFALAFMRNERDVKGGAFATSLIVMAISLVMAWNFAPPAPPALQFVEDHAWIPSLGIHYRMGIDGIALTMMVLTGLLTPLAILASWKSVHKQAKGFFLALLFLESGMMGVFAAADLFLFYVFWEVMLLPMALLIGIWGGPRRIYASVKFVLYTMAGSLLMFVAILYSYLHAGPTGPTMEIATLANILPHQLGAIEQRWLFAAFALSFAIKVPMFPFHTWLPDAHVEAPTAGSVILAGVLLKMGSYGFLRFAIPFFPAGALWFVPTVIALSAIGIVYGSLMSMVQSDIKKMIAYSSVAHLGFVMLGIFSGTVIGAQGGVLQMVNHGISTGALFLLVGVIYDRTHTRGVADFGGLASVMPGYAVIFLIITLSSIGLPGLNGFVGEFLILLGTFQSFPVAAVVGAVGVVLGAVYMLTLYRNVFFGPRNERWADLKDLDGIEIVSLTPLVFVAVWIGLWPAPWLEVTEAPVAHVMSVLADGTSRSASAPPTFPRIAPPGGPGAPARTPFGGQPSPPALLRPHTPAENSQ